MKQVLADAKMKEAWTVRGVTRDITKPSAKQLEALGAETVAADLNNASTLKAAMKGAYAVFAMTNYWESKSSEIEMKQGKAMADAALEEGVQHFVWSSLPAVSKLSKGVLSHVEHFDSKAQIEEYIRGTSLPATFFMPGFYMSNMPGGNFRQAPPNNDWTLALPIPASTPIPLLDTADDTGKFVKGILNNREKTLGKQIYAATNYYTISEIVKEFQEQYPEAGKTAKSVEMPHSVFKGIIMKARGVPDEIAEELLQNMRLMNEFGYFFGAKLDESHSILSDKLTTWKEFMQKAPAFADLN